MKDEKKPAEQKAVAIKPPAKPDRVPVLVNNPNPDKLVPDRTDSTDYINGPKNDPGNGGDPNTVMQQGTPAGTSTGTNTPPANPEPPEQAIVEHPEENPEFPGGMEAWTKYLQRMLRVPDDLEPGDRKTVKVRFVVSKEGEITDVIITQSAGVMFDKEVLRVIAKMPKWKPGKQRGKPVSSYFTQPVTFQGLEE
jgi:protein TonB